MLETNFTEKKQTFFTSFKSNRKKYLFSGLGLLLVFLGLVYFGPFEGLQNLGLLVQKKMSEQFGGAFGPFGGVEVENATVTGAVSVGSDSYASGGKYVQFGSSSVTGTSYYVDCTNGNDANNGTSESTAWKTLAKASSANLNPGDAILLKRTCTWTGTLVVSKSGTATNNIFVDAYFDGDIPIIQNNATNTQGIDITGSYITVKNINVKGVAPSLESGCGNNPKGYIIGFRLRSSSNHVTIQNSKATGNYTGVYIELGSSNNKILNNAFQGNNMMNPLDTVSDNDAGAFGVLIHGTDNEIANNDFSGQDACSYDYGRDGSDVEIFRGQRNNIHHNVSTNSNGFSELGGDSTTKAADNTYAYNKVVSNLSEGHFLTVRGSGVSYGPTYRTKAYNNTVYVTGTSSQGFVCHAGCSSDILTLKNNIIWAEWKAGYADAAFDEGNNIFWSTDGTPLLQFTKAGTSKTANPLFVTNGSDFHLQSASPAVNTGTSESVSAGYNKDLDSKAVPSGSAPDMGVYEYGSSQALINKRGQVAGAVTTDPVIVAVGDIHPDGGYTNARAVKSLIDTIKPVAVLGLGDFQYSTSPCSTFTKTNNYDSDWGALNSIMYPTFGPTHDFDNTVGGSQAPEYMNGACPGQVNPKSAGATVAGGSLDWKEPYSFDIGNWHILSLPSTCFRYTSSCTAAEAAAITAWIKHDLEASQKQCQISFLHDPYWTSTTSGHGRTTAIKPWVQELFNHKVELILSGHNHDYERFYPQNMSDARDDANGIIQFVVGTGGIGFYSFTNTAPNSATKQDNTYGLLKLTLHSSSYDWQFVPVAGQTYTDSGTANCLGSTPGGDTTPPTVPTNLTATAVSSSQVNLSWTASTDNIGVSGYWIVRNGTTIGSSPTNSFTDSTLLPSTNYSYQVIAYDAVGNNSAPSGTVTVTTLCANVSTSNGMATATISLSEGGNYKIWSRLAGNSSNDSYYLQIDDGCPVIVGDAPMVSPTSWTWIDFKNASTESKITANLTAGNHTIKMIGRESDVKLDRLIFTNDFSCTPNDLGDNCLTTSATPTPTPTPIPTPTPTPTPSSQTLTFKPTDDASIYKDSTRNYGSATSMETDNRPVKNFLMKFNVTGIAGKQITSVKLKLYCKDKSPNGGELHNVSNNSWAEKTVNWTNAPSADSAVWASLGRVYSGKWYTLDLANLITGDGTYSLRMTSSSTDGADYYSKEKGINYAPQLEITVQ